MNIFNTSSAWSDRGIGLLRIIVGLLLIYHGQEVFRPGIMNTYLEWDDFKGPAGKFLVYLGKSAELVAGVLLVAGFLTRIAAVIVIGNFTYITFILGHGRFWYEDQHPFMFALFGLLFLLTGAGTWSVDEVIFGRFARSER